MVVGKTRNSYAVLEEDNPTVEQQQDGESKRKEEELPNETKDAFNAEEQENIDSGKNTPENSKNHNPESPTATDESSTTDKEPESIPLDCSKDSEFEKNSIPDSQQRNESLEDASVEMDSTDEVSGQNDDDLRDSSVDPAMVHTAITEKDNPFMQVPNDESGGIILESSQPNSKLMVNPNDAYEDDIDDLLPLKHGSAGNNHNSSGEDSIDVRRHSSAGTIQHKGGTGEYSNTDKVQILEANKLSEGQGRTYIGYTIKYKSNMVRRRYSDFESLRNVLWKSHSNIETKLPATFGRDGVSGFVPVSDKWICEQ